MNFGEGPNQEQVSLLAPAPRLPSTPAPLFRERFSLISK